MILSLFIALSTPADAAPASTEGSSQTQRGAGQSGGREWEGQPYWNPNAGASLWSSSGGSSTALYLGAEAGYQYWQTGGQLPRWSGKTRAKGAVMISGGTGMDVRLGSFIGPRWKYLRLQAGPDVFWNRWTVGDVTLDPSIGVDLPLTAVVPVSPVTLTFGLTPAWLLDESRRVDWGALPEGTLPGFGHEFAYRAGVSLSAEALSIGLNYSYRIVAGGVQQGFAVTLGI